MEYEGQDFAEVERIIPIESLYPSRVLEQEIEMSDNILDQIKLDKSFAEKYENINQLKIRKEKAEKYVQKIITELRTGSLNKEKYVQQLKDIKQSIEVKIVRIDRNPGYSDQEKKRQDGISHHLQGILMFITSEIENTETSQVQLDKNKE
ncbi:MAG: hypothetical protein EZS28_029586 [Streblomastix strix]|uniref:Uncharacterized protein n=1 Tax=Streblomastix strix TaxID=222440 RepID=A0A5J4UX51_9EUKA|nr:MAG: hypothetical protein EZS28_029586 [Streblomastix strix]